MKEAIKIFLILFVIVFINCYGKNLPSPHETESDTLSLVKKIDLHSAVITDNLKAIRQHIKSGSDLNILEPSYRSTPLITAIAFNKTEAAILLIEAGADLNIQNKDGSTPLHTAIALGRTKIANILINSGADLNIKNNDSSTPLHIAAFFCRTEIVKILLNNNVDKTIINRFGQTAYQSVKQPFENVQEIYETIGKGLKPLGLVFDYDHIKSARPQIAAMLK